MISLIKSLLYILIDQYIFLKILRMIVVMTCGYKKCYNASILIYMGYDGELKEINYLQVETLAERKKSQSNDAGLGLELGRTACFREWGV